MSNSIRKQCTDSMYAKCNQNLAICWEKQVMFFIAWRDHLAFVLLLPLPPPPPFIWQTISRADLRSQSGGSKIGNLTGPGWPGIAFRRLATFIADWPMVEVFSDNNHAKAIMLFVIFFPFFFPFRLLIRETSQLMNAWKRGIFQCCYIYYFIICLSSINDSSFSVALLCSAPKGPNHRQIGKTAAFFY